MCECTVRESGVTIFRPIGTIQSEVIRPIGCELTFKQERYYAQYVLRFTQEVTTFSPAVFFPALAIAGIDRLLLLQYIYRDLNWQLLCTLILK